MKILGRLSLVLGLLAVLCAGGLVLTPHVSVAQALPAACMPPQSPPVPPGCTRVDAGSSCYDQCVGDVGSKGDPTLTNLHSGGEGDDLLHTMQSYLVPPGLLFVALGGIPYLFTRKFTEFASRWMPMTFLFGLALCTPWVFVKIAETIAAGFGA